MKAIKSFGEFWPFYMAQHRHELTWRVHVWGTLSGLVMLVVGATYKPIYFLAAPLVSYGPLFLSHFLIEKNKPATFTYPFWSVLGDFRLLSLYLRGGLRAEVDRLVATGQIPPLNKIASTRNE